MGLAACGRFANPRRSGESRAKCEEISGRYALPSISFRQLRYRPPRHRPIRRFRSGIRRSPRNDLYGIGQPWGGPVRSRTSALQAEHELKGFLAAADRVNCEGGVLGGRKCEVVAIDNKASPQESLIMLKQATDQAIRCVASTISSVAHAITDAVARHNARNPDRPVPFLNFNALEPALTESMCNYRHFQFEVNRETQVVADDLVPLAQRDSA
jgi:hypothetical protein